MPSRKWKNLTCIWFMCGDTCARSIWAIEGHFGVNIYIVETYFLHHVLKRRIPVMIPDFLAFCWHFFSNMNHFIIHFPLDFDRSLEHASRRNGRSVPWPAVGACEHVRRVNEHVTRSGGELGMVFSTEVFFGWYGESLKCGEMCMTVFGGWVAFRKGNVNTKDMVVFARGNSSKIHWFSGHFSQSQCLASVATCSIVGVWHETRKKTRLIDVFQRLH